LVEERRKARTIYGLMFGFLGVVLLLILTSFSGTAMVRNKVDYQALRVCSLFCTFQRVPFDVEDVISNATGEKLTRVNVTLGDESFQFYTYNATKEEFVDLGLLNWNQGQLLAFSSYILKEDVNYVVQGRIIYLNPYGVSYSRTPIIKIDEFHQRNWFEDLVSEKSVAISLLMGFALVLTCSLFSLPFIEYHINRKIQKEKGRKKARLKSLNG